MAGLGAALTVFLAGTTGLLVLRWAGQGVQGPPHEPARAPWLGGGTQGAHAWNRYHVRYYAMALLFLAFDMEMVFMYPWAVVFVEEGMKAFVEMLMFIAILVLGILYAWRERALQWA